MGEGEMLLRVKRQGWARHRWAYDVAVEGHLIERRRDIKKAWLIWVICHHCEFVRDL